jgi:hypothetical protein
MKYMAAALPSGVVGTPAGSISTGGLAWSASGLAVTLAVGKAWAGGAWFERSGTPDVHNVTANATGNPRIDRLVLRRDVGAHSTTVTRIAGTPAGSPTAPAVTRTDTVWDLQLFQFRVPASSGTTLTNIIDERQWVVEGTESSPDDLTVPGDLVVGGTVTAADATADTHLVDRGYVIGRTKSKCGAASKTSDGSGFATVTHSLGVVPDVVMITASAPGGSPVRPYGFTVTNKTSSQFTYRVYYDNTVLASTDHDIYWRVEKGF